jgi:hypothetical protein
MTNGSKRPSGRKKKQQQRKSHNVQMGIRFTAKRNPLEVSQLPDATLLSIVTSPECSQSVMPTIKGDLSNFFEIGDARKLENYPGVGKAMALKLEALAEVTLRILGQRPTNQDDSEVFMS